MAKIEPNKLIASEDFKSSSSDNIYTATLYDNCVSCNCPAGGRKSVCKHMVSIIHSNLETLKEANLEFYNDTMLLLEMKNDKNKDIDAFKKLCDKTIFVNREIAEKAFDNTKPFSEAREKEQKNSNELLEKYISIIERQDIHAQFALFKLIGLSYFNKNIKFRYCEFPQNLKYYIDEHILDSLECTNLSEFRKMDKGRKSLYFFQFSEDIKPILRKIHELLSPKFPKIEKCIDEDQQFYVEERIIDPSYL